MRNISFHETTEQFRHRQKHVTRRDAWKKAKPGDILMGCKQVQGITPGTLERICPIIILEVNRELIHDIVTRPMRIYPSQIVSQYIPPRCPNEIVLEGFPEWRDTPKKYEELICKVTGLRPKDEITRILFDYLLPKEKVLPFLALEQKDQETLVTAYKGLNEDNRKKLLNMPLDMAVTTGWKLQLKHRESPSPAHNE